MEAPAKPATVTLPLSTLDDAGVKALLTTHHIGLTVEESRKISAFLGRDPTLVEATIWGIQGSEHCSYKSSRRFLKMFPTTGRHVILGPGEDSGIVALTDGPAGKRWGIVVSHESHNHPSQIVPFEGAATGVGGTVRDVACMGARVIGCMDMLRLGDLRSADTRNIAKEVVRGIAGYGNPLGISNLGGDTVFDRGFNGNCLVNAIAIGLVREDEVIHSHVPEEAGRAGYDIIVVGKPTDKSGFGGASFASVAMEEEKREQNTGAVQEPNPFLERHLLASTYALFDWLAASGNLARVSFKDLGAGGVVCATVEQVAEPGCGANIELERVHVAVPGLPPEIIACAETQERFCWMCHPGLTDGILQHYNETWDLPSVAENARASVIGKVTPGGIFRLTYHGETVCEAKALDVTSGLQYARATAPPDRTREEPDIACDGKTIRIGPLQTTVAEVLRAMLQHPNHASKQPIIRHYDKTVIGLSRIEAGEADASVIAPLQDVESYTLGQEHPGWEPSKDDIRRAATFAADGNPRYGKISAYLQGYMAAIESMCNVAAVGSLPRALTDCLNYGNPEIPEQLGALAEGVRGIADAAKGVNIGDEPVPVISGNVSLYNGSPEGGAIPPCAIVCCIGAAADAEKTVSMRLKEAGSALFFLGEPKNECGGSAYREILEQLGGLPADALLGSNVPHPDPSFMRRLIEFTALTIADALVLSCHDVSDGGLALALFEMTLPARREGGNIGLEVDLGAISSELNNDVLLFTQTPGFLFEAAPGASNEIKSRAREAGVPMHLIGSTSTRARLRIRRSNQVLVDESLDELQRLWGSGLARAFETA